MIFWNYIVLFLCVALLILLVIREIRRDNRARLAGRIAASTLLVAALAALALPLSYTRRPAAGTKEGILLTEGYSPDSVRSYLPTRVVVENVRGQRLSALHIFGYGLTKEEAAALPDIPIVFHPSPMRTGIVSLHWQQQAAPGAVCRIQGRFYNATGVPVKLLLTGMNTLLDSAGIKLREENDFELRTIPVQTGRTVYRLVVLTGADTLEQETLPVEVLPVKPLKILLLAAAPDFENRFLASWLSEKGNSVVTRTAISKEKYDHSYLNISPAPVDHLSASLLDKFDLVIADAVELKEMGTAQNAILERQVAEKGLGLVIKADSSSLGRNVRSVGGRDSILRLIITDKPGDRPLLRDSLRRTLVSAGMNGAGKRVLTTVNASYAWLLAGQKKEYAALWTRILQQAARQVSDTQRWQMSPALPEVNHPVKVLLETTGNGLPLGAFEEEGADGRSTAVYLSQHPMLPFRWEGYYWPRESGWQFARTPQGNQSWWYAWKEGDWNSLHQRQRMQETVQWIAERVSRRQSGLSGNTQEQATEKEHKPGDTEAVLIAKGWFYLLLVLSSLFLWVERKI